MLTTKIIENTKESMPKTIAKENQSNLEQEKTEKHINREVSIKKF